MDNVQINQNQNVVVKVSQILKKLKTYQDRKNFALENSKPKNIHIIDWYLPKEIGFDTSFMIEVLKGKKKYLPLSVSSGYDLAYFRNGDTLTKKYIVAKMINKDAYKDFLPDNIDLNKLSRKFLLSVNNFQYSS